MADFSTVVVTQTNQAVVLSTVQQIVQVNSAIPGNYLSAPRLGFGIYSVKDPIFGAVGDGVTDDTAAIQAALTAAATAGGGVVFVPAGIYLVSATLTLPYRVNLFGCGGQFEEGIEDVSAVRSTLKLAASANCHLMINDPTGPIRTGSDRWQKSRIGGVTFQGNRINQTSHTTALLRLTNCWSVQLEDVALIDSAGYCLYLDNCNAVQGDRVTCLTSHKSPVYLSDSADLQFTSSNFGGGFESALVLDNVRYSTFEGMFFNANPRNTTLSADISASVTTLPVASASGFPVPDGTLLLDSEQITYTSRDQTNFYGCTRGANSTTAVAHLSAARVQQVVSHAHGIYAINTTRACSFKGRADQNYSQSVYCDSTTAGNTFDLIYLEWGWKNATGQAAIFNDGSNNSFSGTMPQPVDANANGTIALDLGTNYTRMYCDINIDDGIASMYANPTGYLGDLLQLDPGARKVLLPIGTSTFLGQVNLDATAGAVVQWRPSSAPPSTIANRPKTYVDTGGPGSANRLMVKWGTGATTPITCAPTSIFRGRARFDAALAQTTGLNEAGSNAGSGTGGGYNVFYLDPADYGPGAALRLRGTVITNDTAPGITFTFGLYPISTPTGGAGAVSVVFGTVVAGSTVAITTPALQTLNEGHVADLAIPTAGYYAIGVVLSGNMAANSSVVARADLQIFG